jgi:hypothetical protein
MSMSLLTSTPLGVHIVKLVSDKLRYHTIMKHVPVPAHTLLNRRRVLCTVHPTWEKFAEIMHDVENTKKIPEVIENMSEEEIAETMLVDKEHPVMVAKVDCVQNAELCEREGIMAYPTLILYVNGGRALVRTDCETGAKNLVVCSGAP